MYPRERDLRVERDRRDKLKDPGEAEPDHLEPDFAGGRRVLEILDQEPVRSSIKEGQPRLQVRGGDMREALHGWNPDGAQRGRDEPIQDVRTYSERNNRRGREHASLVETTRAERKPA